MTMYRDFGENAVYDGDMGSIEMITNWVRTNCLPAFGEYNFQTQKRYLGLNVPIIWIYLDRLDESYADIEKAVLTEVIPLLAERKLPAKLTYIDALTGAQIAQNMGAEEYPMIIILSGQQQYQVPLDLDNPGKNIIDTFMEWFAENNNQAQMQDAGDEYYYEDYDEEDDEDEKVGGGTTGAAPDDLYADDDSLYYEGEDTTEDKTELRRRLLGLSARTI